MEVIEELMMAEGVAIVVRDAKLLCAGVTTNSIDRDKSRDSQALRSKAKVGAESSSEEDTEDEDDDDNDDDAYEDEALAALQGPSDRALRKALVAGAPPGPGKWSGGPVRLALRPLDFLVGRRRQRASFAALVKQRVASMAQGMAEGMTEGTAEGVAGSGGDGSGGGGAGGMRGRALPPLPGASPAAKAGTKALGPGAAEALSLRARAEAEVAAVIALRRRHLFGLSEAVRGERLPGKAAGPLAYREEVEEEGALVRGGKFGVGAGHYRMRLPSVYPNHAIASNSATLNQRAAQRLKGDAAAERARELARQEPWHLSHEEKEAMVEEMMAAMVAAEGELRVASMGRRHAVELMPTREDFAKHLGTAGAVRAYVGAPQASTEAHEEPNIQTIKQKHKRTPRLFMRVELTFT